MASPSKTNSKVRAVVVSLLLTAVIAAAVLSRGALAKLDLRGFWERAYFHLGNVAVSPELLVETLVFLILLTLFTGLARRFLRNEVLGPYRPGPRATLRH